MINLCWSHQYIIWAWSHVYICWIMLIRSGNYRLISIGSFVKLGIPSRHCLGLGHGGTMTSETPDSSRKQSRTLNSILSLGIIIFLMSIHPKTNAMDHQLWNHQCQFIWKQSRTLTLKQPISGLMAIQWSLIWK